MQRKCNNARPPAQCQKTDCPSPPFRPCPTPKKSLPRKLPLNPTKEKKKKKTLKVPTQVMCKYFIRFLNFFFQNKFLIFLGGGLEISTFLNIII
jgi:hypothetical protein